MVASWASNVTQQSGTHSVRTQYRQALCHPKHSLCLGPCLHRCVYHSEVGPSGLHCTVLTYSALCKYGVGQPLAQSQASSLLDLSCKRLWTSSQAMLTVPVPLQVSAHVSRLRNDLEASRADNIALVERLKYVQGYQSAGRSRKGVLLSAVSQQVCAGLPDGEVQQGRCTAACCMQVSKLVRQVQCAKQHMQARRGAAAGCIKTCMHMCCLHPASKPATSCACLWRFQAYMVAYLQGC